MHWVRELEERVFGVFRKGTRGLEGKKPAVHLKIDLDYCCAFGKGNRELEDKDRYALGRQTRGLEVRACVVTRESNKGTREKCFGKWI